MAFIDLDEFKEINDRHGHATGDQLLVAMARRLKEVLREHDTLARIGGDEFIALLADIGTSDDLERVLERMLRVANAPVHLNGQVMQVSASIGVTVYPQDDVDTDQLMRHADQAMYRSKQLGKNRYCRFDLAQNTAVQTQRENLERIRKALAKHEFLLYYQPKVNLQTGRVVGAEALIRWQHPQNGLLAPAAFLPAIEGLPISVEVGEWVLVEALKQINAWGASGLIMPVSVNITAYQLQQPDFTQRLSTLLTAHPNMPVDSLELEILESSVLANIAKTADVMHACQALGVDFSLDDFGTGYSSLTHLRSLPSKTLKIDQTFVHDMLTDPDALAIVIGVIDLGASFHRHVIAEGVETPAHGKKLLEIGCHLAQGYGIARPMPAADLPGWVANWKPDTAWTT